MKYALVVRPAAIDFLEGVDDDSRSRLELAIDRLSESPRPRGCLKLKAYDNRWRIRVGRFRIVYSIFDRELIIEIIAVDDRKDVYRN